MSSRPHIKRTNSQICTEKSSNVIGKKKKKIFSLFCSHQIVSIGMHKNQELLTCNFVLLLSKAFAMLTTCLCNVVQIYATASQVFPALNFLLPCCICGIDTFQNNDGFRFFFVWLGFLVVGGFFCLGFGGFLVGGEEGHFPKPICPSSQSKLFSAVTRISYSPGRPQAPNACITCSDSSYAV